MQHAPGYKKKQDINTFYHPEKHAIGTGPRATMAFGFRVFSEIHFKKLVYPHFHDIIEICCYEQIVRINEANAAPILQIINART